MTSTERSGETLRRAESDDGVVPEVWSAALGRFVRFLALAPRTEMQPLRREEDEEEERAASWNRRLYEENRAEMWRRMELEERAGGFRRGDLEEQAARWGRHADAEHQTEALRRGDLEIDSVMETLRGHIHFLGVAARPIPPGERRADFIRGMASRAVIRVGTDSARSVGVAAHAVAPGERFETFLFPLPRKEPETKCENYVVCGNEGPRCVGCKLYNTTLAPEDDVEPCAVCFGSDRKVMFPAGCGHSFCFACVVKIVCDSKRAYASRAQSPTCDCDEHRINGMCTCTEFMQAMVRWMQEMNLPHHDARGSRKCPLCRAKVPTERNRMSREDILTTIL